MSSSSWLRQNSGHSYGFSLVELTVVVAIVGILAAVVVPAYQEFILKARIAGLRSNLASIHANEQIYHAENNSYTTRLDAMGYQPDGRFEANIGFRFEFSPPPPARQGTPGCNSTCSSSCPFVTWTCTDLAHSSTFSDRPQRLGPPTASTNGFIAEAHMHYVEYAGGGGKAVTLQINQNRQWVEIWEEW